jgi:branched-chain amino acid transport system permease protein
MLLQFLTNGLANGCLYALMGVSFALVYNTTRVFHLAHGGVYSAAAYVCYVLLVGWHWPLAVAFALGVIASVLLGMLMEVWVYAPLDRRNAPALVALLASLGSYTALVNLIALFFGNENKVLRPGLETTYHLGPILITPIQLAQIVTAATVLPLVILFLRWTHTGKAIRAVRDNPALARVIGINLDGLRLLVFAQGSALAGTVAILTALDVGMNPQVGMSALLTAAVALIIGGVGTMEGAVLGGFLLGTLQSLLTWWASARWADALTFGLLVTFLVCLPTGILGRHRRLEEASG